MHRVRWLADFVFVGLVAVVLTCAAAFLGAVLGAGQAADPSALIRSAWVSAWGQAIAALVFLVLTALVFTLAPRLTIPASWTLVVVAIVLGLFGPLFGFPDAAVNASPFAVTPALDGDAIDVRGLWWLVGAVGVGGAASLLLMRRRELAPAG